MSRNISQQMFLNLFDFPEQDFEQTLQDISEELPQSYILLDELIAVINEDNTSIQNLP